MKPTALNSKISKIINDRIADEYTAFFAYQAIANWAKGVGYAKAGEYFAKESDDELTHAKKLMAYLVDWNVTPEIPVVPKPKLTFKTLVEAIETAYNLELDLLGKYQDDTAAVMEMDTAAYEFLSQFLAIQTKSVAEYSDMLNLLEGVEATKTNLLLLEEQLFGD